MDKVWPFPGARYLLICWGQYVSVNAPVMEPIKDKVPLEDLVEIMKTEFEIVQREMHWDCLILWEMHLTT